MAMPSTAPSRGRAPCPAEPAAAQTNRAVSRPSRPTEKKARKNIPQAALCAYTRSTPSRRWPASERAVRASQMIIHVTSPAATSDSTPAKTSSASLDSAVAVRATAVPAITERTTAAITPPHKYLRPDRRSVLMRYAANIPTISAASRPSRSPMRRLARMVCPL